MSAEQVTSIVVSGVEVSLGDTVPIFDHEGCEGNIGTVRQITGGDIQVSCNKCGRGHLFINIPSLLAIKSAKNEKQA